MRQGIYTRESKIRETISFHKEPLISGQAQSFSGSSALQPEEVIASKLFTYCKPTIARAHNTG